MTCVFDRLPARIVTASLVAFFSAAAPASQARSGETEIETGRTFVMKNCARCHAVETDDQSPLREAPALRDLHESYPVENLAEAFAEGIVTGHADMPQFVLSPEEIGSVIAYLKALEQQP